MSPADDPGSLTRLHDIVALPPVSWWPPAYAWYVVGIAGLICSCVAIIWGIIRWRANWYRRVGLAELRQLEQVQVHSPPALVRLAELVKRVALIAYSREVVADLTGPEWLGFLDETVGTTEFSNGPGQQLLDVYEREPALPTPELVRLVRVWIRQHRSGCRC